MARVTVEDCIEQVKNRFDLVLKASHLAREINSGLYQVEDQSKTARKDREKPTVLALREIGDNNVTDDQIEKRFILNTIRNTYGVDVGPLPPYTSQLHQLSAYANSSNEYDEDSSVAMSDSESSFNKENTHDVVASNDEKDTSLNEDNNMPDLDLDLDFDSEDGIGDEDLNDDELELKNSPLATLYRDKQLSKTMNVEKYDKDFEDLDED